MSEDAITHMFKNSLPVEHFKSIIAKGCRAAFKIEVEAHDRGCIPEYRLYCVTFANPEDRDRARIAMRFVEQDYKDLVKKGAQKVDFLSA